MFEMMTVGEILRDLRSIKVPPAIRSYINESRSFFEANGALPIETQMRLRQLCNQYKRQMRELHSARARARKTNGLRALGISRSEAAKRVEARRAAEEARKKDVGF